MKNSKVFVRLCMVFLTAFLLVQSGLFGAAEAAQTADAVVTAGELNVRKGPGTDYENVMIQDRKAVLTNGLEVTILGEKNGWYHIRTVIDGEIVEGYSIKGNDSTSYFSVTSGEIFDETQILGSITAVNLNLRKGPSTEYDKVQLDGEPVVFTSGQELVILGEKDGWYHIKADYNGKNVEGFCLGSYVEITWGDKADIKEDSGILDSESGNGKNDNGGSGSDKQEEGQETGTDKQDSGKEDGKKETGEDKENGSGSDGKKDESGSGSGKNDPESDEFDPTDLSAGVPEGYEIKTLSWAAKFNFKGIVASEKGLNLRKSAKSTADVIAVLEDGQEVEIIKSTVVTTKDENGKKVKTRWYRVIANIGGEYAAGYVVSNYVTLDCSEDITATTKNSKQVIRKTAKDGAKRLRTEAGKVVKLAKGTRVVILDDVVGKDGIRYFRVSATYKKTEYIGYIPALALATESNAKSYSVQILSKKPEPAKTEEAVKDEQGNTQDNGEGGDNSGNTEGGQNSGTGTDNGQGSQAVADFEGANAWISGSAGLAVSKEAKGSSDRLFTEDKKLILLYNGDPVQMLNVVSTGDITWCYIRFYYAGTEYFGYIRSKYIQTAESLSVQNISGSSSDANVDFETKLEREGFPESYKQALRELHALYPAWEFKAFHTGLDWNDVIAAETEVGVNLIPNSKSVEWKSLEKGAYSWKTDTFTVFDGSTWVTASKEAVEYYMDPRNFLDYNTIFQFEVLTYSPDYQDYAGVNNILKNTAMYNNTYKYKDSQGIEHEISFTDTFLMAAEYTGVSPFHLASRVKQEVTLGTDKMSNSVTGTVEGYEGLYNYYNIGAYHSTESGGAIRNGLKFAKQGTSNVNVLIPWTDPFKAILGGAYYIGANYINKGQDTIYLQKFNVTNGGKYSHQYMANVEAPYSEGIRVYRGYVDPDQIPIVFSIPVYLNMPEEKCGVPEKKYNPNNWLKTLKISNIDGEKLALTPTFDYTVDQEYSLIVDSSTDYLKIKATTVSSLATIAGDGAVRPEPGLNRIIVSVTAENGDVREYIINIVREEAPQQPEEPDPAENGEGTGDTSTVPDNSNPDGTSEGGQDQGTNGDLQNPDTSADPGASENTGTSGTTDAPGISEAPENPEAMGTPEDTGGSSNDGQPGDTGGSGTEETSENP